jgi:hypothetical protein
MSISSIGQYGSPFGSNQYNYPATVNIDIQISISESGFSSGGNDQRGGLLSAIGQALQQSGITPSNSNSAPGALSSSSAASSDSATTVPAATTSAATSTTAQPSATSGTTTSSAAQTPGQALSAFIQALYAALQSASGQSGNSSNSGGSFFGHGGRHHHHGGGGSGGIQNALQNLIQDLSPSSTSNSGGAASTGSSSSTGSASNTGSTSGSSGTSGSGSSSSSALSALETSFNNLLTADGVSGSNVTLQGFLQNLSQDLPNNSSSSGNFINIVG